MTCNQVWKWFERVKLFKNLFKIIPIQKSFKSAGLIVQNRIAIDDNHKEQKGFFTNFNS